SRNHRLGDVEPDDLPRPPPGRLEAIHGRSAADIEHRLAVQERSERLERQIVSVIDVAPEHRVERTQQSSPLAAVDRVPLLREVGKEATDVLTLRWRVMA